jgi:hypothetical protein
MLQYSLSNCHTTIQYLADAKKADSGGGRVADRLHAPLRARGYCLRPVRHPLGSAIGRFRRVFRSGNIFLSRPLK